MPQYNLKAGSVQHNFYSSRKKIQVFGGAFANGKTTALVIKALHVASNYPGADMLLARETYPKLNDTLRKVFLKWCPPAWIRKMPTQEDNTCYFHNGTNIQFRYIAQRGKNREDGSTTSNLLSATYDFVGIDQAEDPGITRKDFDDLIGRLRGNTPYKPLDDVDETLPQSGPRWLCLTLNPTGNWLYRDIIKPVLIYRDHKIKTEGLILDPVSHEPLIEIYESDTYANRDNLPEDYIQTLEATYQGQMRERYLLGKWVSFEGLVYGEFSRDRNILSRHEILSHLADCLRRHVKIQVVEALDFGITSPCCYGLGFVDDYGRLFLLDGFHKVMNYDDIPREIGIIRSKYLGSLQITQPIYGDPSMWKKSVVKSSHSTSVDTLAKLLEGLGISMKPAENSIIQGIAKLSGYIAGNKRVPHILTYKTPGPLFYVANELSWFYDEITSYFWKRNPLGKTIDEPVDDNDHAMDMAKYLLTKLPEASKVSIPQSAKVPDYLFWHEREDSAA